MDKLLAQGLQVYSHLIILKGTPIRLHSHPGHKFTPNQKTFLDLTNQPSLRLLRGKSWSKDSRKPFLKARRRENRDLGIVIILIKTKIALETIDILAPVSSK